MNKLLILFVGLLTITGCCRKSRQKEGSDACPMSTMNDCVEMVEWADKVITF